MCGIAGAYGTNLINKSTLQNTLHLMKNRGPDFSDYYENEFKKNGRIVCQKWYEYAEVNDA